MSYKALYRKYRPKNFNEVIGQDHIISTLKNIIAANKVSHAYLFTGPRGTGKTSVAHIFAHEINQTAANININKSDFDIIEIDAASHNGVAEIRKLIDNSHYSPASSQYKVYIIDEVHMLTRGAFNALLKTLEEPPQHLIFILATTEPHKIPTTILSRTQRFNFRRINDKLMMAQLKRVLDQEDISYEKEAIKFVVRLAQGGMRDALSIVDQAAAYGNNKISFATISQVFGIISLENQIKILNFIYKNQTKELLITVENFINNGIDVERLINSLIDIVKDYIVYQKTNDLELCSILTLENLNSLVLSIPFAYEAMSELIEILKYVKFSEMKKQIFEISLLKLAAFKQKDEDFLATPQPQVSNLNVENISKVQENIPKEPKKTSSVDAIEITQDHILDEEQDEMLHQDIDDHITSTQDIPLNEFGAKQGKPSTAVNLESELNVHQVALAKDVTKVPSPSQQMFDVRDLINYLQHADKDKIAQFKVALSSVINWIDKVENKNYITLIQESIFISGGEKFVIISSKDEHLVNALKEEVNKQAFIDLMSAVLGEPVQTIAISEAEFKAIKIEWQTLLKAGTLPPKHPIKEVIISAKPKSHVEQFGEDLFGELFK